MPRTARPEDPAVESALDIARREDPHCPDAYRARIELLKEKEAKEREDFRIRQNPFHRMYNFRPPAQWTFEPPTPGEPPSHPAAVALQHRPSMLLSMPNEIIREIGSHLCLEDLGNLSAANCQLSCLLVPYMEWVAPRRIDSKGRYFIHQSIQEGDLLKLTQAIALGVSSGFDSVNVLSRERTPMVPLETALLFLSGELLQTMMGWLLPCRAAVSGRPLNLAARLGNAVYVSRFLEQGNIDLEVATKPSLQAEYPLTALQTVCAFCPENAREIAIMLLEAGADIDAVTADNKTPLHYALDFEAVDVNAPGKVTVNEVNGWNKYMWRRVTVAIALITYGADLDAQDAEGCTAFHRVVLHGDFNYRLSMQGLEYFGAHGGDCRIKNNRGQTALDLIEYTGWTPGQKNYAVHTLTQMEVQYERYGPVIEEVVSDEEELEEQDEGYYWT